MAPAISDTTFRITLRSQRYEIDIAKLTGRERVDAKRLLGNPTFSLGNLWEDEVGIFVLAFLAARRLNPQLSFDDVLDLPGDEVTIEFPGAWKDGDAKEADPFGPSEDAPSETSPRTPKKRSSKSSSTPPETPETSGDQG